MINIKVLKENIKYILSGIGILLILIGTNMILEHTKVINIVSLSKKQTGIHKLVINEIVTDNEGINVDENGDIYDWIELYNGTDAPIDLTNYGLSDKEDGSIKWIFPEVTIESKAYLIVYLSGKPQKGLYANFKLKNIGGELITLKSDKGQIIDTVRTEEIPKNNSMYRDNNGKWQVTDEVTPGFENSTTGRDLFINKNKDNNNDLQLSEVLPCNDGNIIFENDKLYGYVEVANNTEEEINLNKYYLSNETNVLYKWHFPDYVLKPKESYLVLTNKIDKDNNASFELKHKTGKVVLSKYEGIVDSLEYTNLTNGVAYIKTDNMWHLSGNISPGYPNNTTGKIEFQKKYDLPKNDLIINEVMSSNSSYLVQSGNQYYDWIELYNNTNKDITLSDYTLTTDYDDIYMYTLPNVVLKPKSYYLLMASGNDKLTNEKYTHTNFKLSSGEGLFLFKKEKLIDSTYIYGIPKNNSYGRGIDFGHYFYSSPTPGNQNKDGIREISYNPTLNVDSGIYNDISKLEVKIEGSGDIYYTLDGSIPSNKSIRYQEPISLSNTSVIKAVAYEQDKQSSDIITKSYIINENHSLPVMSISLNNWDYNYLSYNLYSNKTVNAYVELYEKDNYFQTTCGLKLFGGQSRQLSKKSFSLEFNKKYSEENLNYKLFDNKDLVQFNDLVLRSGSQDQESSMIRDEFVSKMLVDYGTIVAQASKPTVLYINGNYWGVYYIREKINPKYIENNFNVKGNTNIIDYLFRAEDGTNQPFIELRDYIKTHDMSDNSNYEYVKNRLDIDNFIDFYVVQFITNNEDQHNIRYYNNSELDNGKIKVITYDFDYAFVYTYGSNYIDFLIYHYGLNYPPDTTYLEGLLKNKDFRKRFVERIAYYMKNVWTEEHVLNTYNYFYNQIEPEMRRNASRWNQSYDVWLKNMEELKSKALSRINDVKIETKEYFKLSQEEFNEYFK